MHHNEFHALDVSPGALTTILVHQYLKKVLYGLESQLEWSKRKGEEGL